MGPVPDPDIDPGVDPDVDLHVPTRRAELAGGRAWPVFALLACGGALGAAGRYGLALLLPARAASFPWATFLTNALGCALIGVLLVLLTEGGRRGHPLLRPFLGTGVLGGFTTFSTYAVDVVGLLDEGAAGLALGYLAGTLLVALGAVWLGVTVTRRLVRRAARSRRATA
ncbi:hypothetical protein AN216_20580 [Streptomyces oceani]|uniref:Fluoride-specific ion channel FluC n=2 Tax=Streptomyces oceani TaxID=1075402 RepID=A0A1E7JXL4_9ACTN|nr:CrcB family protein [Streptomyces oceani]OEU96428.1 hypothetical protein AN216_20580 [Streptomyces oceani]